MALSVVTIVSGAARRFDILLVLSAMPRSSSMRPLDVLISAVQAARR